jgi:hypothetical protein
VATLASTVAAFLGGDWGLASLTAGGLLGLAATVRGNREIAFVQLTVQDLGDRVGLLEAAISDPARADILSHGLETAPACRNHDQLALCAHIVAEALDEAAGPLHWDRAHFLLNILGQLQPLHLEVLRAIRSSDTHAGAASAFRGSIQGKLSAPYSDDPEATELALPWLNALGLISLQPAFAGSGASDAEMPVALTMVGIALADNLVSTRSRKADGHQSTS